MQDTSPLDPRRSIAPEDDKRAFRRYAPDMLAFVRLPAAPLPSLTDCTAVSGEELYVLQTVPVRDLSMTGLSFVSKLCYPVDADLEVCLCLNRVEYTAAATIKRRQRVDNTFLLYGVHFLQSATTKEFRIALASLLLRQDAAVRPAGALRSPPLPMNVS